LLLKIAAGDIGLSFVVVAYGMLLSFFRRLGLDPLSACCG
jgi:hypothetical protein